MNIIEIHIGLNTLVWVYAGIKILVAMFLQKRYKQAKAQSMELPASGGELWSIFIRNSLFALEWRIVKVLVYPLYAIVVGRKGFRNWMTGENNDDYCG